MICLVAGILLSTSLSMVDANSDNFDEEQNPFFPIYYEQFHSYSFRTALAELDVENDGDLDYAYGVHYKVMICQNKGLFEIAEEPVCELDHDDYFDTVIYGGLASGDMNNDGFQDIITGGTYGKVRVVENNGLGGFEEPNVIWTFDNRVWGIDAVDWNEDGLNDIVLSYCDAPENTCYIHLLLNQDNGQYSDPIELHHLNFIEIFDLNVEDFDGDSDWDILISYSNAMGSYCKDILTLLLNDGDNGFDPITIAERGDEEFPDFNSRIHPNVASADYDQDGDIDIAFGDSSGIVEILFNEGSASFIESGVLHDFGNFSRVLPSDYDQDGDIDLVISTEGFHLGEDSGFYVIYNNINPMSLQTPQPNHLYLFNHQLKQADSSLLIGPTTFRINRQVDTDYVEFYVNDKLMHTDNTYPFEWRWSKLHFGEANVKITGYFADGTTYTLQEHYTKIF